MARSRQEIERKIKRLRDELKAEEIALNLVDVSCDHVWEETKPDHIYHEGYTTPGDAPGTMGVDFRGPCHVPAKTEKRWRRRCAICWKEEYTTRVSKKSVDVPFFPG